MKLQSFRSVNHSEDRINIALAGSPKSKAARDGNTDMLNKIAAHRKLPGYESIYIAVDTSGRGLCLRASAYIPKNYKGFHKYTGTERLVSPDKNINSVPLTQLMYGCEYFSRYLQSLIRYKQAPNPRENQHVD